MFKSSDKVSKTINHLEMISIARRILEDFESSSINWCTKVGIKTNKEITVFIVSKRKITVSGLDIILQMLKIIDSSCEVKFFVKNGDCINIGEKVLKLSSSAQILIGYEKVLINILSFSSSISFKTSQYCQLLTQTNIKFLHRECQIPSLRVISRIAAFVGGAYSSRFFFKEAVTINEHHVRVNGSLSRVVGLLTESLPPAIKIEIEISKLEQVREAVASGVHLIVLKDMSLSMIKMALHIINKRVLVEVSGDYTLEETQSLSKLDLNFLSNHSIYTSFKVDCFLFQIVDE